MSEQPTQKEEAIFKLEQSLTARLNGLIGEYDEVYTLNDILGTLEVIKHKIISQYSPYCTCKVEESDD